MSKNIRISILGELDKATKTKIHDELKRIEKSAKIKFKVSGLEGIKKDLTSMQKMVDQWASKGFIGKESINKTKMDIANTKAMYREMFNDIRAGEQIGLKHETSIINEKKRLKSEQVAQAKAQNKAMEQSNKELAEIDLKVSQSIANEKKRLRDLETSQTKAQNKAMEDTYRQREIGLQKIANMQERLVTKSIGKDSVFKTDMVKADVSKLNMLMEDFKNKGTTSIQQIGTQFGVLSQTIKKVEGSFKLKGREVDSLVTKFKMGTISAQQFVNASNVLTGTKEFKQMPLNKQEASLLKIYKIKKQIEIANDKLIQQEQRKNAEQVKQMSTQGRMVHNLDNEFRRREEMARRFKSQLEEQMKTQQKATNAREVGLRRMETIENRVANMKIGKESLFTTPAVMKDMEKLTSMMTDFRNKGTTAVKDVDKQYNQLQNSIKSADKQQQAMNSGIIGSVKKMLLWSIAATAIYAPIRSFKQGLATLKEIDTELVNIAKVTNMTKEEMGELAKKATEVAIAFGRTTQEYLSAVTQFSRAGYGDSAAELGELSMLLQNVGDINSDTANSFLLATDAAYKLGGSQEKLKDVISGVNNVANKNATSVSKVAEGMSVSASMANQAGIGIGELSGAISTMTIVSQRSGTEAGRAFKGIIMRLRQIKGESDGEIIDEESMAKAEKALYGVGISIREMRNGIVELRNPMVILDELAKKWKDISTIDQSKLIEGLGGVYRGEQLVSLLAGWETYEKTVSEYLEHNNSAIKENERYLDSWQAKSKQLSAAVTQMWQTTINTEYVKKFIDGMRAIIEQLTRMGGLVPIISTLLGYLLVASIMKNIAAFGLMAKSLGSIILMIKAFQLKLAVTTLVLGGWIPVLTGVVAGITAYYIVTKKATDETDEFTKAMTLQTRTHKEMREELDKDVVASRKYLTEETSKIDLAQKLTDRLYDLSDAYNGTEIEMARMLQVKNEINNLIPSLNIQIDRETGKIINQREEVNRLIQSQTALMRLKAAENLKTNTYQTIFESKVNISEKQKRISEIENELNSITGESVWGGEGNIFQKYLGAFGTARDVYGSKVLGYGKDGLIKELRELKDGQIQDQRNILDAQDRNREYDKLLEEYMSEYADLIIAQNQTVDTVTSVGFGSTRDSKTSTLRKVSIDLFDKEKLAVEDLNRALLLNKRLTSMTDGEEEQIKLLNERVELLRQLSDPSVSPLTTQATAQRGRISSLVDGLRTKYNLEIDLDNPNNRVEFKNWEETLNRITSRALATGDIDSANEILEILQDNRNEIESLIDSNIKLGDTWWSTRSELAKSLEEIDKLQESINKNLKEQIQAQEKAELEIQKIIRKGIELKKKALDDELKKVKETTDDIITEKEREWAETDSKKNLDKKLQTAKDLQEQINALMRDTSLSGIHQRRELEKKLAEQKEKINETQEKRSRELQKQNLKDMVVAKEDEVKKDKELIDEKFTNEKIAILAHEALVNETFVRIQGLFPELFEEMGGATTNFFDTFTDYHIAFGGEITSMNTKMREFKNEILLAVEAVKQLSKSNTISQDRAKVRIGELQTEWNRIQEQVNQGIPLSQVQMNRQSQLGREAQSLRDEHGLGFEDLRGYKGSFSKGINAGNVTKTGNYLLHGSQSNPEWVLTNNQMKNMIKNLANNSMPKLAGSGGYGDIGLHMNFYGSQDESVTDKIKQAGRDVLRDLRDNLRKRGG